MKNISVANSGITGTLLKCGFYFYMVLFSTHVVAAAITLIPNDSNSRITVENAVIIGNETTVFFFTWPYIGDPNSGKECPLNYYSVTLKPGLPSAIANVVAKAVCGGIFQKSRLLDNGDALIMVHDRLERWRNSAQVNSQTFASIEAVSKLGVNTDMTGGQFYDISPQGDVVLLIRSGDHTFDRDEYRGSSMVMSSLKPGGARRWEERFSGDPMLTTVDQVWAAPGGSALLHFSTLANGLSDEASQLIFISADSTKTLIELNKIGAAFNFDTFSNTSRQNMTHEEVLKQIAQQSNSIPESIKKLEAVARADGGFDVLFHRKSQEDGRNGHFLYRIGPDGSLKPEISLGGHIVEHGLERWFDFFVNDKQLVLLSSAAVTQKIVRKVKRKWGQNIVSWIDLDTGIPTARMIPLDLQYLEAALNAGDEGRQYLDGLPGGEPALLTNLGGKPLVVSVGWISHRQVLRINEADEQLTAYTEAYDEKQAKLAQESARKQRNAEREARKQRMNSDMASAVGMTAEEFAALSNKEHKEVMVRSGNIDAMMSAIMAQMNQGSGGQYTQVPGLLSAQPQPSPAVKSGVTEPAPGNTVILDINLQGFLEFDKEDGRAMTLLIFNRQTGDQLFKKDFPDGVIYEFVDFSRFNTPLQHIAVNYTDTTGIVLKDLTPVINQ